MTSFPEIFLGFYLLKFSLSHQVAGAHSSSWDTTGQYGPSLSTQVDHSASGELHMAFPATVSSCQVADHPPRDHASNISVSFGVLMLTCTSNMSSVTGSLPEHNPNSGIRYHIQVPVDARWPGYPILKFDVIRHEDIGKHGFQLITCQEPPRADTEESVSVATQR